MMAKLFRHYKGGLYEFISMARHSETEGEMVVYKPLYNDSGLWVRPADMFFGFVEISGGLVRRFEEIKDE